MSTRQKGGKYTLGDDWGSVVGGRVCERERGFVGMGGSEGGRVPGGWMGYSEGREGT